MTAYSTVPNTAPFNTDFEPVGDAITFPQELHATLVDAWE